MRLQQLVSILNIDIGAETINPVISGVQNDSRLVKHGDLFVAISGLRTDGHKYVAEAVQKGARAIVCEHEPVSVGVPCVTVRDSREALALLAAQFYGHPSKRLRLVGVTGTKGKTTVSTLIREILISAGQKTGLLGTVNNIICDDVSPAELTTPESITIQKALSDMVGCASDSAVMEVSSHSLSLNRVFSCEFDTVAFTNFTQDHLDYHKTMEHYFEAKTKLFRSMGTAYFGDLKSGAKACVLNLDDPAADQIRDLCGAPVITYGMDSGADVSAREISYDSGRCSFLARTPFGEAHFRMQLAGRIGVYNSLAAIGVGIVEGIPLEIQKDALESVSGIPGRFERVDAKQKFAVIVDYAHSPDSLMNVLNAARDMVTGRVILVFGCGGDRDRSKRPIMGAIAARLADRVFITTDNPRSEEPEAIIDAIEEGLKPAPPWLGYSRIVDRSEAIRAAIAEASCGDVVLIAGKGHETYQVFKERSVHFDDREQARCALDIMRSDKPYLFESGV